MMCTWLTYQHFGYQSANRPLLIASGMMALVGVMLIMNGLVAERQSRTYHESQDKATYVIREIRESASARPAEGLEA